MGKKLDEKVSFDFIRYANCWEDADILLEGLNPHAGSKILSIGSAGDNSFSLLTTQPEIVVAVDINKVQLYLIELKKAVIQYFEYPEVLAFLGFQEAENREQQFKRIKNYLTEEARSYWENNIDKVKKGIISQGKFERYFQLFSHKILPWIHSGKTVKKLFDKKNADEQRVFYEKNWNTWRWRLLFRIFFSKYTMGKYGRDPEFLKEVKVNVGEYIFNKAQNHLRDIASQENFMLHYNLTGSFGSMLPHYLQPNHFEKIKNNITKLFIKHGYAEDAIKEYGRFHFMNLSNIFEYMNQELFQTTAQQLATATYPGGRLAYWNLMVPRRVSDILTAAVYLQEISSHLTKQDKGFFYNQFIIDEITHEN